MDNDPLYNPKKKARKGAAKKKPPVRTMTDEVAKRLEKREHYDMDVFDKNSKGKRIVKRNVRMKFGSFILIWGEERPDLDGISNDLELWLAVVANLWHDPKDGDVWFQVRYFWARGEVDDRLVELGRDSCERQDATGHLSIDWERPWSSAPHYDWVAERSVAAQLGKNEVRFFDECALHPSIIPRNCFYWRCTFDDSDGDMKYPSGRSLCAFESCESRSYQPRDECSQVFCAHPKCMRWMHVKCHRSSPNRVEKPDNLSRKAHVERRILSTPLSRKSQPACDVNIGAALSALVDTERKVLLDLASAPIVRPTFVSISGNIDEVLTARNWIYVALAGELDNENMKGLRRWLRMFKPDRAKSGWHEAVLRAQGTPTSKLKGKMDLAKKGELTIELDVCSNCGTPV